MVEEGSMEKKIIGARLRCVELLLKEVKGSSILKILKWDILVIHEKITWITWGGKLVKVREDCIYGKVKLSSKEDFASIKAWM
jgi:hypothetical protein